MYLKIITEEVVLIECMYLDEKRGDFYRVVKYCQRGYIFVSCSPCVLAMDTTNVRGPVFMDGKFVFILFVMVIVCEQMKFYAYFKSIVTLIAKKPRPVPRPVPSTHIMDKSHNHAPA